MVTVDLQWCFKVGVSLNSLHSLFCDLMFSTNGAFVCRNQKYEREVVLLRRYFGELLIGIYKEKLFISDLPPGDIEQTEVMETKRILLLNATKGLKYALFLQRLLAVSALDLFWREHLINMNRLRSSVSSAFFLIHFE
jgi:hypothetical protein